MKNLRSKFTKKKILIYGFAKSGLSTLKFLKKIKSEIYCWDDNFSVRKNIKKKYLFNFKKKIENNFFDFIVVSPGIDIRQCYLKNFLAKNKAKIITDLDIFYNFNNNSQIISVTGTNGKSTTCKLLEAVFKKAGYSTRLVGNIGEPILSIKRLNKKTIIIVEVSSYQLEYTQHFKSNHAAILNISFDHIERHRTMVNYINSKIKILKFQSFKDNSYLNLNNKFTKKIIDDFKKKQFFSKLHKVDRHKVKKILKKIKNKYLLSQNNLENISFVLRIASNYKIRLDIILQAFNKFKGLPHRQERLSLNNKIICINDSKATNFESSLQSLKSYKNILWIVGGLPKKGDKFFLNKFKENIIKAYIIGKSTVFFKNQLRKKINFVVVNNLRNAVLKVIKDLKQINSINNLTKNKYTILFSPAAASFDQFANFEDRGKKFKELIYRARSNIY